MLSYLILYHVIPYHIASHIIYIIFDTARHSSTGSVAQCVPGVGPSHQVVNEVRRGKYFHHAERFNQQGANDHQSQGKGSLPRPIRPDKAQIVPHRPK